MDEKDYMVGAMLRGIEIDWTEISRIADTFNFKIDQDNMPNTEVLEAKLDLVGYTISKIDMDRIRGTWTAKVWCRPRPVR